MIHVQLTIDELRLAAMVGVERRLRLIEYPDAHGPAGWSGWGNDIEGAAAELAVARTFGRLDEWKALVPPGERRQGDVGNAEVRACELDYGSLLLHDRDRDDAPYFLVIGTAPRLRIVGWVLGRDGKVGAKEKLKDGMTPCYRVKQNALKPVGLRVVGDDA